MNIYIRYISFLFLFVTIFLIIHIFKRNYYPGEIIFYEGLQIIIFLSVTYILILIFLKKLNKVNFASKNTSPYIFSLISYFFICYSYLVTVPTMVDRSLSLYIIKAVSINENGLHKKDLLKSIQNDFFINQGQYNKRIEEQMISGNIHIKNDILSITKKGKTNYKINLFFKKLLNI